MAKKRTKKGASTGHLTPTETDASSGTPWATSPEDTNKPSAGEEEAKTTSSAVRMGPAGAVNTGSRWSDTFDYAPWAASVPQMPRGAAPMSPEARARLQASLSGLRDIDPIDNYDNPWGDNATGAEALPLSRRDAIRTRAAAKRRAEIHDARDPIFGSASEDTHPAEGEQQTSDAAPTGTEARTATGSGAGTGQKTVNKDGLKNIPIENLPNGVINVLGDGLVAVVDTGINVMKPVVRIVPPVSMAGLVCIAGAGVFYGYTSAVSLPWKI